MFRRAGCSSPNFTVTFQLQKSSDSKLNAAVVDDDDGPGRATERFRCENSFTSMGLVVGCWCCCCFYIVGTVLPLTTRTEDTKTCGSPLREREKGSSLLSVSTQLFWSVMVALVLLLLLPWCGGPFSEIPVRGAAERAHTRCGGFSISRRIALHTRGERGRKNKNCVVAQTNRRGEGRRTFKNQISGVQHFASATDELPNAFSNAL